MNLEGRALLLESARKIFAAKGFKGSTTREIAKDAGVNIGMISYYFGGKKDLYLECIEKSGFRKQELAKRILKPSDSLESFRTRLEVFLEECFAAQLKEASSNKIVMREFEDYTPLFQEVLEKIFKKTFFTIVGFFQSGIDGGYLRENLSAVESAVLLQSYVAQQIRIDPIRKNWSEKSISDPETKREVIFQMVEVLISGMKSKSVH